MNHTVLMSDALNFSVNKPINPYYGDSPVDTTQAIAEHNTIKAALMSADINVVSTTSPSDSQDGVYTANWALVRGEKAVLARLPEVRKAEEAHARDVLQGLGKEVVMVPEGLRFSGQGDALPCGSYLFCGMGYRSDEAAQAFAAEQLGYQRIQLQTIPALDDTGEPKINAVSGWPDSFFYDIDLALSVIKQPTGTQKGLIAYCPEAFMPDSRALLAELSDIDKIEVSIEEAQGSFACNLVSTGTSVVMSAHAPRLKNELESRGMRVITPEISELAKGGGYIRCTTLTLA